MTVCWCILGRFGWVLAGFHVFRHFFICHVCVLLTNFRWNDPKKSFDFVQGLRVRLRATQCGSAAWGAPVKKKCETFLGEDFPWFSSVMLMQDLPLPSVYRFTHRRGTNFGHIDHYFAFPNWQSACAQVPSFQFSKVGMSSQPGCNRRKKVSSDLGEWKKEVTSARKWSTCRKIPSNSAPFSTIQHHFSLCHVAWCLSRLMRGWCTAPRCSRKAAPERLVSSALEPCRVSGNAMWWKMGLLIIDSIYIYIIIIYIIHTQRLYI